jgi:hypothetical protein
MTTKALFVKLEAKLGKENEVAKFLRDGQGLVQQEPATTAWFGIRLGPTTFAIFDARFPMRPDGTRICREKLPRR